MKTNDDAFDDFEDDFGDQDLNKLTAGDKKILLAINKAILENMDNRTKTVGDRILVWDSSRLTNAETGERVEHNKEELVLTTYPSIVIEDRLRIDAKLTTLAGEFTKVLDLKVWNKKLNKVYLTSSDFVKLT